MSKLNAAAALLTAVGGINWGLVALAEFDLVAALTGNEFGETSVAHRRLSSAGGCTSRMQ